MAGMGKARRRHIEKRELGPHHLKAWREHRDLTLDKLSREIGMTASNLSKIERREQAYTQPVIEALSRALRCTPCDLLMNPPAGATERAGSSRSPGASMVDSLSGKAREELIALLSKLLAS